MKSRTTGSSAREKLTKNEKKIEHLVKDGKTINQIMRAIGLISDGILRKWLKEERPDLMEKVKQNGTLRKTQYFGRGNPKEVSNQIPGKPDSLGVVRDSNDVSLFRIPELVGLNNV